MLDFTIGGQPGEESLEVPLSGHFLLDHPMFNKGTAFTEQERVAFRLLGLLPPHVNTLEEQVERAFEQFKVKNSDLERHIFLRALQDQNEVLFYRLVATHISEMTPIVYTPTVGAGCESYSRILRKPRGLFISFPERDRIDTILDNRPFRQVDVIVVTDGERILGLGDQGAGGMGIPVGKLSLYTVLGGIHPSRTLPVLLDVGTDNQQTLTNPMYVGWCHERVRGPAYDDFIDAFVQSVKKKLPHVLLQWEDFAQANAGRLLARYRDQLCTFNDDIQGAAAVTVGTLLAAVQALGARLRDQQVAVAGAGSAGCGISQQLVAAMVQDGLSEAEARSRFWLVDRAGLLREGLPNVLPFQQKFVQPQARLAGWQMVQPVTVSLIDVVKNARPTILIGVSGQLGIFTEAIIREMSRQTPRPIILPLSNPTSRSEALPADLITWTEGRALVATGSPFADVTFGGRTYHVPQCNNSYIFPALGLGVLAVQARRVTDGMFMAASRALAACSPVLHDAGAPLLPPLDEMRPVVQRIALAVAAQAQRDGVADKCSFDELEQRVAANIWTPHYPHYVQAASR